MCADAIINTAAARVPDDRVRITGRGRLYLREAVRANVFAASARGPGTDSVRADHAANTPDTTPAARATCSPSSAGMDRT